VSGLCRFRVTLGAAVLAALAVNFAVGAIMIFGTIPRLHHLAAGQLPFDLRPGGYDPAEAHALLKALGDRGRDFYAHVQLPIDMAYPATYALSRGLLLWWLTVRGRLSERPIPLLGRLSLMVLPVATAAFDYRENAGIAAMLADSPTAGGGLIASTSIMTQAKLALGFATEVLCVVLIVITAMRWRRRVSARRPSI
jgi:hypothetical protein